MICIQANTLDLILRVTKIILEKDIFPITDLDHPLEVYLTKYQWFNLRDSIISELASDIFLENIKIWDSANREYLKVSYDSTEKTLIIEDSRQYNHYDSDSLRPLFYDK